MTTTRRHPADYFSVLVAAAFVFALSLASPARATTVLPLYLEEIIDTSTVAFEGTCTGNRTERDPETNFVVTYTTFAVHDVLKGSVGTTHEIKQIGGTLPDSKLQYRVEGIPSFGVGQDYVVFLAGVSAAGFSSPIGLQQGKFTVKADGAARTVRNGRDFNEMTARLGLTKPSAPKAATQSAEAPPVFDMDLDQFKSIVRKRLAVAPSGVAR
jgi:hypothetical protein